MDASIDVDVITDARGTDSVASDRSGVTDAAEDAPPDVAGRDAEMDAQLEGEVATDARPGEASVESDAPAPVNSPNNVLEHHKRASRDGLYVDAAFTKAAAAKLHMDPAFHAPTAGPTYAQPLYMEGVAGGKNVVFAVTEQNRVYALDAGTGIAVWQKKLGEPVPSSSLPCGNIDPVGITGTPIIDFASRRLFVDAMTTPDGGTTKKHLIFALSVDDGSVATGWPVDVSAAVKNGPVPFDSTVQNQRSALSLVNGTLYVPYGGHAGDCGDYRGWVVAVPIDNPGGVKGFATGIRGGGIWSTSGVAFDGTSLFVTTGNTFGATDWSQGEAVLRLQPGAVFSGQAVDYFTPSNWKALDGADADLGGTGAIPVDVPGATPSKLLVALGKNGVGYLLDRANLGGLGKGDGSAGEGVFSAKVALYALVNATATYRTMQGTYIVFRGSALVCPPGTSGDVMAMRITPTAPPQLSIVWCAPQSGGASPIVTTTDGQSEAIVWGMSAGLNQPNRVYGFDADTGQMVFAGGTATDVMTNVRAYSTPIAVNGRIFVAADNAVYAFTTR